MLYSGGIAALAGDSYDNLAALLLQQVAKRATVDATEAYVLAVGREAIELQRTKVFEQIPGHEHHYVSRSEYLHRLVQPRLDDLLYLGTSYERLFDRFEILLALVHVDQDQQNEEIGRAWGPIGRFGWKYHSMRRERSPLLDIKAEAEQLGERWGPLHAGLFRGSLERFLKIWAAYEDLIAGLHWM